MRAELRTAAEKVVAAQADADAAVKALSLYQRKYDDRPRWLLPPKGKAEDRGTLVAVLSDTHYGEVVLPAEVGGYNAYNLAIAEIRTERFFRRSSPEATS